MSARSLLPLLLLAAGCRTALAPAAPLAGPEDAQRLPLGRSPRRQGMVTVMSGEILDTASGARLALPALLDRLSTAEVVLVGESHAHRQQHAIEAQLLDGLAARAPGTWALGMEMFPRSKQPWLDRWVAGELEERDFVRQVGWYDVWGFDWRYYRELLLIARARKLPVVALNVDPALARQVGRSGVQGLSPAERASLPALDLSWEDHRRLFRALLGLVAAESPHGTDPHRGLFENLYQAQVLWDTFMAESARSFLEGPGRGRRLLVVAGSGHLLYGLGINGRLAALAPALRQLTVVCDPMPAERPGDGDRVSAGLADFVWGTDPEGRAEKYPSLGVRLADRSLHVLAVSPHGAAAAQLQHGDELVSLDGRPLEDAFDLHWRLGQKDWGDTVRLRVRRAGQELDLEIHFRR